MLSVRAAKGSHMQRQGRLRGTSSPIVRTAIASGIAVLVAILAACGSRGPLDDGPIYLPADAQTPDAAADVSEQPTPDASMMTPTDAGVEGGLIQCGECVVNSCGTTLLMCFQSQPCQQA